MAGDFNSNISLQIKNLNALTSLEQRLKALENFKVNINLTGNFKNSLEQIKKDLQAIVNYQNIIGKYGNNTPSAKPNSGGGGASNKVTDAEKQVLNVQKQWQKAYLSLNKMDSNSAGYAEQENYVNQLKKQYTSLQSSLGQTTAAYQKQSAEISNKTKLQLKEIQVAKQVKTLNDAQKKRDSYDTSLGQKSQNDILAYAAKYSKALNKNYGSMSSIYNALGSATTNDEYKKAMNQWSLLQSQMSNQGLVKASFIDGLSSSFANLGQQIASTLNPVTLLMKYVPQMVSTVKQIDSAMTELYKVTDNSEAQYSTFSAEVKSIAQEIGSTQTELINSTADFARLGYSLTEATSLSKQANLYKNVGDMDISHATEYMISTLKAYNMSSDEANHIVDAFNEVGNNYAISSEGLGEAVERAGAALAAANNTFEESLGLITAGNNALQNPASTGTMLKTIAMRIRGATTELEDAGESTEGMATSTSKLRDELLSLSGVDILEDGGNAFKSTYDIMKELSQVWDNLSDLTQANITELIAGKRGGSIMASLMSNFDDAENATKSAINSEGSALRENESVLESIEGRITKLKATFESLSSDLVNSGFIKILISGGDGVLKLIDTVASKLGSVGSVAVITTLITGIKKINELSKANKLKNIAELFTTGSYGKNGEGIFALVDKFSQIKQGFKAEGLEGAWKAIKGGADGAGKSVSTFSNNLKALGIAGGVAVAALYAMYRIMDATTRDLGEIQQDLTNNLNEYDSAQNEIDTLSDKLEANKESIKELEASSSLSNATEIASLKQANAQLEQQIAYQEQLAKMAKDRATLNADEATNYSGAAYDFSFGKIKSTSSKGRKIIDALIALTGMGGTIDYIKKQEVAINDAYLESGNYDAMYGYMSEEATLELAVYKYNEAKNKLSEAMSNGSQEGVEEATEEMSKYSDIYTEILQNYYDYLDAYSSDDGTPLEGYEAKYKAVRAEITKINRDMGATNEATLETILGYYENDGIEKKLAKLQQQGKLTSDYLSDKFSDFVQDLEDVGMTAQDVVDIFADMYKTGGFASNLIYDNLSEIQTVMSAAASLRSTLTSAMAAANSAGGLDFENYYNLITNGLSSAVKFTRNGIKTDYSSYQSDVSKIYSKKISENVSDIKQQYELYDDVLAAIEKTKSELKKAQDSANEEEIKNNESNLRTQQSYINTIKQNIKYLEAERSVYDGLNSNVTKYIDSMTSGMASSTVTDSIVDSISDLKESVTKGKVSTPQAREFADLFSFEDLSGIKNSDVAAKYQEAINKFNNLFSSTTDDDGKTEYAFSDSKFVELLKQFEQVGNIKFLDDKNLNMTTSDIMNLAKWLGVSESAATELVTALNDYGYNVDIADTTKQVEELEKATDRYHQKLQVYDRVGSYITAAESAKQNGVTTSEELDNAVSNLGSQADSILHDNSSRENRQQELESYIEEVQKARDLANDIGDGEAEEKLQSVLANALQVQEELNRSAATLALMNVDTDKVVDGDATGLEKLQDLQEAIENYNVSKTLKYEAGIDVDVSAAEGDLELAYDNLAQYIQNNFESLNLSGLNLDIDEYSTVEEIEAAIRNGISNGTFDLGTLAAAFNIQLNESDVEASKAEMYEAIRNAYVEATQMADAQFGAGNYTLSIDMNGNVTGIQIQSGIEVPEVNVKANTKEVDSANEKTDTLQKKNGQSSTVNINVTGTEALNSANSTIKAISGTHNSTVNIVTNRIENKTESVTRFISYASKKGGGTVNGTAHSSGSWGTKKTETALVGELGEELVVHGDQWYTVGSRGAEFSRIPAGSIVFNHKQTEELFKNGYVTSNGGRAHANGTAYATGTNKVDFVDMQLDKYEYDLDLIEKRLDDYQKVNQKVDWLLNSKESTLTKAKESYRQAYMNYQWQAKSVGLSAEYAKKVEEGAIDVQIIGDENLRNQIEEYQEWIKKARDAYLKFVDYDTQLKEVMSEKIDAIVDTGNSEAEVYKAWASEYEAYAKLYKDYYGDSGQGKKWGMATSDFSYSLQAAYLGREFDTVYETYQKLLSELGEDLYDPDADNREQLAEYSQKLAELEEEMVELEMEIREVNDAIKEMNWAPFEQAKKVLESVQDQLDSVVGLVGDFDSFSSNGSITDYGKTQFGLLASSLVSARQEVANYNETFAALKEEYEQGIINIDEYTNSVNENRESQLSAVTAVQKYKNSITKLIEEGINAETSAYKELINARKEDLNKQKESNDYAKSISEKTSAINKIQAQIAALSGDDSQASRAKLRSLEADLKEAQDELEETRQDHYYDELSDAYDDEYDRFEEAQQKRIDALSESLNSQTEAINNALSNVEKDYQSVYSTLSSFATEYGITFSDSVISPWKNATSAVNEYYNAISKASSNITIETGNFAKDKIDNSRIFTIYLSDEIKQAHAKGTYSAINGLALTDETGIGSEAILTKNGVLRQLDAGDTVFNASQRKVLWEISKMPLPTILDNMQDGINAALLAGGNNNSSANVNVNYDSLITVNGNVDKNILPNLEQLCKQASEYTKRDMLATFKKLGVG